MIKKYYELNKTNLTNFNMFLIYGKNEGLQNEIISKFFLSRFNEKINNYEENEFINNIDGIVNELRNKSLFETRKLIIISRATDKIYKFLKEILNEFADDIKIIIKSSILDRKSKLRNLFEKEDNILSIPVYEDTFKELLPIVNKFLTENKISISRESINLLIDRASGDRKNLKKELDKIYNYSLSDKNINFEVIKKLSNLVENFGVNELADNYLSRNKRAVYKILNENNYSNDDCVLILRTLLNKAKRLLDIIEKYDVNKNIDEIISSAKPPIFWKDKENVKKQAISWKINELKDIIYKINEIETIVKTNSLNSLNLLSDFIVNN